MEVSQGIAVNAAWTNQIVMRANSTAPWTSIKSDQVKSVGQIRVQNAKNVSNSNQYQDSEKVHIVMADGTIIKIEVKDVTNQAAWNVGGVAGLAAAHADLADWLS